jgi:hypothetical protein
MTRSSRQMLLIEPLSLHGRRSTSVGLRKRLRATTASTIGACPGAAAAERLQDLDEIADRQVPCRVVGSRRNPWWFRRG